ncbi:MAG: peptidoglycan-binding protein [Chloroflexota bacterium]
MLRINFSHRLLASALCLAWILSVVSCVPASPSTTPVEPASPTPLPESPVPTATPPALPTRGSAALPTDTPPPAASPSPTTQPPATQPPLTAAATATPTPTTPSRLALRSPPLQAPEVAKLQARLMELGYREVGWVDGVFSAQTDAAVRHFQYLNNLPVDGVVDQATDSALYDKSARAFTLPPPFPGEVLRAGAPLNDEQALHARLASLGYLATGEPEWIQNRFGPKTHQAVERFQQANHLQVDGALDMHTWSTLFSPWAVPAEGQAELPRFEGQPWQTTIFPTGDGLVALAFDGQRLWSAHSSGSGYYDNYLLPIDPAASPLEAPAPVLSGDWSPESDYAIGGMQFVRGRLWLLYPSGAGQGTSPAVRTVRTDSGAVGKPFEFARCPEGYCFPSSAFGFDGSLVWASASNLMVSIDPGSYRPVRSLEDGWSSWGPMVFDGRCMWLHGEAGLAVFNTTGSGKCPYAEEAYSLPSGALAFDGKRLWLADNYNGAVVPLDVKHGALGEPFAVGSEIGALAFDGRLLWIADAANNALIGMDVETGAMGQPVQVGEGPSALLYAGQRLWVACTGSRTVQYIDPATYTVPLYTPRPTLSPTPTLTATPRPPLLSRELRLTSPRMQGDDVLKLQQRLLELGYTEVGAPDGVFGPMTDQAVRHFQQVNGLVEDGVVGQITWAALFSPGAKSP